MLYICPKIEKPIYETEDGSMCGVYDRHLKTARSNQQQILIRTNWHDTEIQEIFNPKELLRGEKIKKVFLRPNDPMILFKVFVKAPKPETEEDKAKEFSKSLI